MGISDEAKNFLCLTNSDNDSLYDKRKIILHSLGENVPPSFYGGTGCYYPTFRASFFDINALLNFSLKHINKQYEAKGKAGSFHLSYVENFIHLVDYKVYQQKDLGFTLTVFDETEIAIKHYARLSYPLEFGGVLIGGYADNGKHIYLTEVLLPDVYENSRAYFKGDTKKINFQLKEIYDKSQGNIIYLGDWHSHPNMTNQFSSVDFHSIEEQAKSTSVNINNPLLAIVSIGRNTSEIGYYIYYEGSLYKFHS